MSRSFFHVYRHFMKFAEVDEKVAKFIPIKHQLGIIGSILVGHCCYVYGTKSTDTINVSKTYMYTQNGFTQFMVIDKNGKHYNVNNSFWYWKWNSIEDWNKMEIGEVIHVKYYGYRIPLLGIFPNIVSSRNIYQDNPIFNESIYNSTNVLIEKLLKIRNQSYV